jgi:hypothetical protein
MAIANSFERQMLDLINAERQAYGLAPLELEQRLNAAADDHSAWMLAADVFSHTGSGRSTATERMATAGFDFSGQWVSGENIAFQSERGAPGIADDVIDLHNALMNSPGHRANILSDRFEYVGIGIVEGTYTAEGRDWDGVMITQNFAATAGTVVLDTGAAAAAPPNAGINGLEYIASYADLIAAFGANADAGVAHYTAAGRVEGRIVSFDGLDYIASYEDLIAAFGTNAEAGAAHFITNGRSEGRFVSFDGLEYIASYEDLIAAFGANASAGAAHFITNGRSEGRSVSFDGLEYIASYADLIAAFGTNAEAGAEHFITNGFTESRARDTFDAQQYLDNYSDLAVAFGSDHEAAVLHYIQNGFAEGRTDEFMFG